MTDHELVAFIARWERRIARLQRKHPARWRVPGLSDDEVRDALTLRLIEAARGENEIDGWPVTLAELARLRKRFRLGAMPADLERAPIRQRAPDQEEAFLEREAEDERRRANVAAEGALGRPQRRWLAAMKMAANAGAFFDASEALNLSAAARLLGKNRSSATRAYAELQNHFRRELEKLR